MFDKSAARAALRPQNQLLNGVFLSFTDYLDAAVGEISDPSRNTETLCLPLRAVTKVYPLNYAVDYYVCSCFHCQKRRASVYQNHANARL